MTAAAHAALYTGLGLLLLTGVGNWACRATLNLIGLKDAIAPAVGDAASDAASVGWLIGWLERVIVAIGLVAHSWEVLAVVIALKTIARFKEMDEKVFAEYFLVGSLFSMLWAIGVTGLWLIYDRTIGCDISGWVATLLMRG